MAAKAADDNILELQPDTIKALEMYAEDERARMDNPLIQELITWRSVAQKVVKNALMKQGYMYRDGKVKER